MPQIEYLQELNDQQLDAAVTSDSALAGLAYEHCVVVPALVERPGSEDVARLGLRKLLTGQSVPVEALDANYLRRSDAEIFSQPQAKSTQSKNPQDQRQGQKDER